MKQKSLSVILLLMIFAVSAAMAHAASPVAVDDSYATNENTDLSVNIPHSILLNDSDADNDTLTAIKVTDPSHGTLVQFTANGSFYYTPSPYYAGNDTFTYLANDGTSNSTPATVTINVSPVNYAPTAVDDNYVTDEDTPLTINSTSGVLANDTDPDGDSLAALLHLGTTNGNVTLNADGSFTYTPNPNYHGLDFFRYKAFDGALNSTSDARAYITVNSVNDVPATNNDTYTATEDTTLVVGPTQGVLHNDTDADGDTITAILVSSTSHGSLTLNSNGGFTYTPNPNFDQADSFVYVANDGAANSTPTTATINMIPVNDAPVASNVTASANEDTESIVTLSYTDVDTGDKAASCSMTNVVNGAITTPCSCNGAGTCTVGLTPVHDFPYAAASGTMTAKYTVTDTGALASNQANMTITVNQVNDAPVMASIANQNINEGDHFTYSASATDVENNTLAYSLVAAPASMTINSATGAISWDALTSDIGTHAVTVMVTDNGVPSLTDTKSFNITVADVADYSAYLANGQNQVLNSTDAQIQVSMNTTAPLILYLNLSGTNAHPNSDLTTDMFLNISSSNDAAITFPISVRIYYTNADLKGIDESKLRGVMYYNTTAGAWQYIHNSGVNTADTAFNGNNYAGYVWAVLDHFSSYSPVTDVTPPDTTNAAVTPANVAFVPHTIFNATATVTDPIGQDYSYISGAEVYISNSTSNFAPISLNAADGTFNDEVSENVIGNINIDSACSGSMCDVGSYTAHIRGYDQAGNYGTYATASFNVVDVLAPGIVDMTSGSPTTGDTFHVLGTAADDVSIASVAITTTNGVTYSGTPAINGKTAAFDYTLTIPAGATGFSYTITVTDWAGNAATAGPISLNVIDNDAPAVSSPTLPAANSWHNSNMPVSVAVTDNIGVNHVTATLHSGSDYTITLTGAGTYTGTFAISSIPDGTYTLIIDASDAAGNHNNSVTVANVHVDKTAPLMTSLVSDVTNNITLSTATVLYTLTATEANPNTITLSAGLSQAMAASGANTWTYSGTPASLGCTAGIEGNCTVTATIIDMAGNTNSTAYTFRTDDQNPRINSLTFIPFPIYNDNSVNVSSLINDTYLSTIKLEENSTGTPVNHTLTNNGTGTYTYTMPATLYNGEVVNCTYYAADAQGNTASSSQAFTVSNRAPAYTANTSLVIQNVSVLQGTIVPTFNIAGAFSDADHDTLTYSYAASPSIGSINITVNSATGDVVIRPTDLYYYGDSYVVFRATDPFGAVANSQVVKITYANVADSPILTSFIPPQAFNENNPVSTTNISSTINLNTYFFNPESGLMNFTKDDTSDPNIIVNVDNATGMATITAVPHYYGIAYITIKATNMYGSTLSNLVTINVTNVNEPPVINDSALLNQSILNLSLQEDFAPFTFDLKPYEFDYDNYDNNLQNLTWSITGADASLINLSIDPATHILYFNSVLNSNGAGSFTLNLNDSKNNTANPPLTLNYTIASVNDAPTINASMPASFTTQENAPTAVDLKPYEHDVDSYDVDANLTWSASNYDTTLLSTVVIDPATKIMMITPVNFKSGSTKLTLTLTDSMGATATRDVTINVVPVNQPPSILSTPPPNATEHQVYTYAMNATDGDTPLASLAYSTNDTARFTVNGNAFTWTPNESDVDASPITVNFSVNDGNSTVNQTATITVINVNDPPVITSTPVTTATLRVLYQYQVNATDPDKGDTVTYSIVSGPTGMTIAPSTGMISWVPQKENVNAQNNVIVAATDMGGLNGTQSFAITVANINDPPAILSTPNATATEHQLYSYAINASDPDLGDVLTYSVNDTTRFSQVGYNNFTWTPNESDVDASPITVNFSVSDGNHTVNQTATITVINVNDAPVIAYITSPQAATEKQLYQYRVNATDPDKGDSVTYSLSAAPAGMVIGATSGMITWIPQAQDVGISNVVTVVATDSQGANATASYVINVADANDAPIITTTPNATATQGQAYSYVMNASSPYNYTEVFTYHVNDTARFTKIGTNNFTWTPTQNDVNNGTVSVMFSVDNGNGAVSNQTATITVSNANDAPFITSIPVTTATEKALYQYQVNATDADIPTPGDTLTYSLITSPTSPAGMTIDSATGLISWIPQESDVFYTVAHGGVPVAVKVSDNAQASNLQTFTIAVVNVNDAPTTPVLLSPATGTNVVTNVETLSWNASTDPDPTGDTITYYVYNGNTSNPTTLVGTTATTSMPVTGLNDNTTYYWYVVAQDNHGLNSSDSTVWSYTTSFKNAPNMTNSTPANSSVTMNENESMDFSFAAQDINVPPAYPITYEWKLNGQDVSNGTAATGQYTFSLLNNFTSAGDYVLDLTVNNSYGLPATKEWNIHVNNVNLPPYFVNLTTAYTINESQSMIIDVSNNISDDDSYDQPPSMLTFSALPEDNRTYLTQDHKKMRVVYHAPGNYTMNFTVTDTQGASTTQQVSFDVLLVNQPPIITSFSPLALNPVIKSTDSQDFSITEYDRENATEPMSIRWYVNGIEDTSAAGSLSYTYHGDGSTDRKNVTINATVSDGTFNTSQQWALTQTAYPIADTFNGATTDFTNVSNLASVSPLVLERTGYGKIVIPGPIDLSDVAVLDGLVRIEKGAVAIDTNALPMFAGKTANVTLYGLSYTNNPTMFTNPGFTTSASDFSTICTATTDPACTNINATAAPTTSGTASFTVSHFTSFMTIANSAPVITSAAITSAYVNESYTYHATATDADGDTITYSLVSNITGMTIDSSTGIITWTPASTGLYSVQVQANDGRGGIATQSYTIDVNDRPQLVIKKVDVTVAGKKDSGIHNGDTISREAKPGDKVSFDVQACNNYTRAQDIKLRNVMTKIRINGIDSGNDIQEDSTEKDISPNSCQTFKIDTTVPTTAEEDNFDVQIELDGQDSKYNDQTDIWDLSLAVKRDSHKVIVSSADLTPSVLSCNRASSLSVKIDNVGRNDESNARISILNSDLGISMEDRNIQVDATSDASGEYIKTFSLTIPSDAPAGEYPITITSYYDGSTQSDQRTTTLTLLDCTGQGYVTVPTTPTYAGTTPTYAGTTPTYAGTTPTYATGVTTPVQGTGGDTSLEILSPVAYTPATSPAYQTAQVSFTDSDEYVLMLIVGLVIVLGIIGYFVGYLMMRRR